MTPMLTCPALNFLLRTAVASIRNDSNLSHPSPLVIPSEAEESAVCPRLSRILPGKRSRGTCYFFCRRCEKKYEAAHNKPVSVDGTKASGRSFMERGAITADTRLMAKPA